MKDHAGRSASRHHPLTRPKLRAWLKSQRPTDVVGYTNRPSDCPCNRCLVDLAPKAKQISVYPHETDITYDYLAPDGLSMYNNPKWLTTLVYHIDNLNKTAHEAYVPVFASQVLEIMDKLWPEYAS